MDQTAFENQLKQDGFVEIAVGERSAGEHSDSHAHDFTAVLLILDGEISVTCDGKTTTCRAGDTFQLEAGRSHTEDIGPEGVRFVYGRKYA